MADHAKSSDVGKRVHGPSLVNARLNHFGSSLVQSCHRLHGSIDPSLLCDAFLDRRRNHTSTERLGKYQSITGLSALVRQHALGIDDPSHRISELGFFIANAVATDYGAVGLHHLRQAAGE